MKIKTNQQNSRKTLNSQKQKLPKVYIPTQQGIKNSLSDRQLNNKPVIIQHVLSCDKSGTNSDTEKRNQKENNKTEIDVGLEKEEGMMQGKVNQNVENGKTHQIKVVARFRPLNSVEQEMEAKGTGSICVDFLSEESVKVKNSCEMEANFTLDRIFDCKTPQFQMYEQMAKATIEDVLNGYNGTIFAYGQSGSGKTYTMYGNDLEAEEAKGIIPRAIRHIFETIYNPDNKSIQYQLKFSMLEIYKENLYDLLEPDIKPSELKIKENPKTGIYVSGLSQVYITDEDDFLFQIESADENRATASTGLNAESSRSHLLFQLEICQTFPDDTQRKGTLNLVDLAGSEKVAKTHAIGQTLEEAKKINLSLSTLGNVIHALTSNTSDFVPYRDSKLTRVLKDSLGGNFKTTLVVTCSPHVFNSEETITTLKFAQRAKKIQNKVKVNIKRSVEQLEAIIEDLTSQLRHANNEILSLKGLVPNDRGTGGGGNQIVSWCGDTNLNDQKFNVLLKAKDDEISQLNDKIEVLANENKLLSEKILSLEKENNFTHIISSLEKLSKDFLQELKIISVNSALAEMNQLKSDFENLKTAYSKLEEKYFTLSHHNIENNLPADEELDLNEFYITKNENVVSNQLFFDDVFSFFKDGQSNSHFPGSYLNIFTHSKMYTSFVLSCFLKRKDLISERLATDPGINEKLIKEDYHYIKKSYLKLISVVVHYEKVLFDFMNRALIDIRINEAEAKNKVSFETRLGGFVKMFSSYLEVLDEVKSMKIRNEKTEENNHNEFGPVQPFASPKAPDDLDSPHEKLRQTDSPSSEIKVEECNKLDYAMLKATNTCESAQRVGESERKRINSNIILGVPHYRRSVYKNIGVLVGHILSKMGNIDSTPEKTPLPPNHESLNFLRKSSAQRVSEFLIGDPTIKHVNSLKNNFQENKKLKLELELYKNTVETLTKQLNSLYQNKSENEKIIKDFQQIQGEILKRELENVDRVIKIYKSFYENELQNKKNVIEELAKLVDEMYLNCAPRENFKEISQNPSYLLSSPRSNLNNYYIIKKEHILTGHSDFNEVSSFKMAEAMIKDGGTATKKLDYILFQIESNKVDLHVEYGSGLQGKYPSKSPLSRNLMTSLVGDYCSEVNSSDSGQFDKTYE